MDSVSAAPMTFGLPRNRGHYYGGAWHEGVAKVTQEITCPATGESLGVSSVGDATDASRAVASAATAFAEWRDTPAQDRAACVRKAAAVLRANAEELAWIDAMDGG